MKALINEKKISAMQKVLAEDQQENSSGKGSSVYDISDIEFVGSKKDKAGKFFGTIDKEFFIFKIKQSMEVNGGGGNSEAYLVIACK